MTALRGASSKRIRFSSSTYSSNLMNYDEFDVIWLLVSPNRVCLNKHGSQWPQHVYQLVFLRKPSTAELTVTFSDAVVMLRMTDSLTVIWANQSPLWLHGHSCCTGISICIQLWVLIRKEPTDEISSNWWLAFIVSDARSAISWSHCLRRHGLEFLQLVVLQTHLLFHFM